MASAPRISSHCFFGDRNIKPGAWTYLKRGAHIYSNGRVEIGDHCTIEMYVMIITSHHEFGPTNRNAGPIDTRRVSTGDGCSHRCRVAILPGVRIAPGCVIAADPIAGRAAATSIVCMQKRRRSRVDS